MPFRLSRRALRLDKCNVVAADATYEHFVVIYQGQVYSYAFSRAELTPTLKLNNCRTVLHQSIACVDGRYVFMGEYGANSARGPVPVYGSADQGRTWRVVYEFPEKTIKHVHGCYWDPYEKKVWVTTGDFPGECQMLVADLDFKHVEKLGDGHQSWRAVCLFFRPDAVYWIMDSQLETNHLMRLDRATRRVTKLRSFPGPVWYGKDLADGVALVATANEIGPGVHDDRAHVFASRDLETWNEVVSYPHDRMPKRYFKFGVVGFADGAQSSERFYLFGEALSGLDGKVAECSIQS